MEENEVEKLKKENEQLRLTIRQLRKQLDNYETQARRRYELERDHLPYHDYDRD